MAKMTDEFRAKVEEALRACVDMRKQGILTDDLYHKQLVCLAYEYANAEEELVAAQMLMQIPLSYYQKVQAQQMAEDKNYLYVAWATARHLVDAGIVDLTPVKPTMPMGNA